MPFRVPRFNLVARVWHGTPAIPPAAAPDLSPQCQLVWDRAADIPFVRSSTPFRLGHVMKVRFPARTDVRDQNSTTNADVVEVPSGSGRFYLVFWVDDVGRGFANEYRQAMVMAIAPWPTPDP